MENYACIHTTGYGCRTDVCAGNKQSSAMVFRFVEENNMFKVKTAENAKQDELTLTGLQKLSETAAASQEKTSKPIHSRRVGKPMTTAPAFTRDGNCVTADARNNTPAGTATITDWQVQEVVNITIK